MLARNETIFKWALYAGATAVFFLLQGRCSSGSPSGASFPLCSPSWWRSWVCMRVPSRLRLRPDGGSAVRPAAAGVHPLLYTLIFPAAGLCAALISQSLLAGGLSLWGGHLRALLPPHRRLSLCRAVGRGKAAWAAGAQVFLREVCVSILLVVPVVLLFSAVFRRTHLDD